MTIKGNPYDTDGQEVGSKLPEVQIQYNTIMIMYAESAKLTTRNSGMLVTFPCAVNADSLPVL